ncbi:MAG: nuclear transport factor 2 family protein [Actinomycetota bacterium]
MGARKDDTWGAPLVLVVEPDREDRELLRRWLAGTGAEVLFCPGPRAPRYRCAGGQGGPCPLAEAADVVVLDLDLDSEVAGEGTACEELVSYYTGLGKPVVAFGPYAQVVRPYAESGVRTIGWPVRRDELTRAVTDAYEGREIVPSGLSVPEAPEVTAGPGPVEVGLAGMVVARDWVDRMEAGDPAEASELYAPKSHLHVGGVTYAGREAILSYLGRTPLLRMHPLNVEITGEDPTVLVRWEGNAGTPGGHTRLMSVDRRIAEQWLVLRSAEEESPRRKVRPA